MGQQSALTEGRVFSALIKFAIPFLLANLLQAFYGAADLMIVGWFANAAGVSAVSIGSQLMQTVTTVILGLTTGGTVLVGQYIGAKREEEVARSVGSILCVFAALAVVITLLLTMLTGSLVSLMHTPEEAAEATWRYTFICACGVPFIVGYNALSGILRGIGDSKSPLLFIAVACVANVAGDLCLVAVLGMGATGAALATVGAQAVSLVMAAAYLRRKGLPFPFGLRYLRISTEKAGKIFRLGLPIALQNGLINISFLIITAIANGMGLIASASLGVVEKIIVFAMLPSVAFASAVSVMAAQNMGAGKPERARQSLWAGIGCALVFGVSACVYAQISPESVTGLFAADPEVVQTACLYLRSYSIDCILTCFLFSMNSFFSGCGHTIFPMVHSLIATFLVRVPVSFLFSRVPGATLFEIGLAAPLASAVSLVFCFWYLASGRWKTGRLTES